MDRKKEIILEFKSGNYDSFDEYYHATKKIVYLMISTYIKRKEVVEDLIQDTYIKFLNNITSVNVHHNPDAYLAQIAKNLAINEYNKSKREDVNEEYFYNLKESVEISSGMDLAIIDLLAGLEREIVILHIVDDMKFKDIALSLDKPLGTVLWLYNKAIKKLREKVGE